MGNNKNFVASIKEYIDNNYADQEICMDFFNEMTGYHVNYITTTFRRLYGVTPIEYLQTVRLEKAKTFIESGMPLGQVVYKAGYSSQRTFYRIFEQNTGMTPGIYKRRAIKTYEQFKEMVNINNLRPLDYAKKACAFIMHEYSPANLIKIPMEGSPCSWVYWNGMTLLGFWKVYECCNKKEYYNYIKEWVEDVIKNDSSKFYEKIELWGKLDSRQPLSVLLELYNKAPDERYIEKADRLMKTLKEHPTTSDGILCHYYTVKNHVYINSIYMVCPSMCRYAKIKNEPYFYDIAALQPELMYKRMLNKKTGLLCYGYDESKSADWADPKAGLSPETWGRAMGYYVMGILDMLDFLPDEHISRAVLENILKNCLNSIKKYQHESGRWYQIPDMPELEDNGLENSCSCMFTYAFAKAVNMGLLDKEYAETAIRGYSGIIDTITYDVRGRMLLKNICITKTIGDLNIYMEDTANINNLHGLGPFILMCTEIEKMLNNI